MGQFQYSSSKKGDILIIKIGGNLDATTSPSFHKKIKEEIDKAPQKVVISMDKLDYIASAGLGVIISFNDSIKKKGGIIKLSSMSDKVKKIFKLLGFINLFEIHSNDEKAIKSF